MFSLTYISSALQPFSTRELRELLNQCVDNNRRAEVTGMLLYQDGNFMQVLEGAERAVRRLHGTISRDWRHRGIITLDESFQPGRLFPEWCMGFKDLGADLDNPEGYSEFLNLPLTDEIYRQNPSKAQQLLLLFKDTQLGER